MHTLPSILTLPSAPSWSPRAMPPSQRRLILHLKRSSSLPISSKVRACVFWYILMFFFVCLTEAEAAKEAGLNVVILSRPGNAELTDDDKAAYPVVESFADIPLETVGGTKRKIDDVTPETPQVS